MTFREFFTLSTWWGKLLGAFFGFLTAGPIGALFGILVGNFFDRGLASHFTNPHWYYLSEKRKAVQKAFFETTFSVMGHIAKADGRVTEQEINMAKLLMKEMRLSSEQQTLAKRLFNEGKQKQFKLDSALFQLKKICRDNRELLKLFVDIQYRAAQVDGLTTTKIKVLDIVFACLGFAPLHKQYRFYEDFNYSSYAQQQQEQTQQQTHQQQQQQHHYKEYSHSSSSQKQYQYKPQSPQNNLAHAYALIEVSPDSSKQEVKRAYRRLLSRNHPDKLIAQGLPEEMIKLANDKTHKIMKAYELICQSKGW
ncbi:co-chaperone DjlA [Legionella bononiensis]|uniref:Co-chaperone protein DjlA n=1 Tax=Legionella bononiensis TaxID=2793102 RepID=A0ABS1WAY9_9GAMM|nr:co-chaperone DjlA [Legionella bononiensis]MBL7480256.1 co-chaperone DjlA [Legionella bononiensis]MBL7526512.1 co-chaperone DjlA [Legionella bononiensis]MBL7562994.1 co-chaperone DjlA [Legionella bononiensis]